MWNFNTATVPLCVSVFSGHTDYVSSLIAIPPSSMLGAGSSVRSTPTHDDYAKQHRKHAKRPEQHDENSQAASMFASGGFDGEIPRP